MVSPSRRRAAVAAALSAAVLAGITACTPAGHGRPEGTASPVSPEGSAAAAAYIARHPAPPMAGMESGILVSSEYIGTVAPASTAWRWSGTVIETGGRVVRIGTVTGGYDCTSPQPPIGLDPLLDAYIYFPADSSHLCPPDGVIVIRRSAVRPGGPSGWTVT